MAIKRWQRLYQLCLNKVSSVKFPQVLKLDQQEMILYRISTEGEQSSLLYVSTAAGPV